MTSKGEMEPATIIRMYGYEYHLVYRPGRPASGVPDPCFMGKKCMALASVNKINGKRKK